MNIKNRISVICTLVLSLIISGCGSQQRLDSTQTVSTSVHTLVASEVLTVTETPRPPAVTATSTLHPSLINCIPTPISVFSEEVPNTPEVQEIIKTVQKSEEIYMRALITSDPSDFPTVFINDPRFPVSLETLDTVKKLSNQSSLQSAGWLDYKMAYFTAQIKRGNFVAAAYLHTPEPSQTVPPDFVWCDHSFSPPELRVLSMNIDDDIALIVIHEGVSTYELTLVFVNAQWFIAAHKVISISP